MLITRHGRLLINYSAARRRCRHRHRRSRRRSRRCHRRVAR